ncbi:MAG: tRNA lysidine(34) synthetase TilS [Firmicutes bacterium]|nr:tRNA lysidine(34) synthetase TilS [Bacillota bacterium]
MRKVREIIKKLRLIPPGDSVLAAVSGGADSVCLLHLLSGWRGEMGFQLYAAHLDHGLRGAESAADGDFVEELCGMLRVPFRFSKVSVGEYAMEKGLSTQEAARQLRYAFLGDLARELGASRIAVGHNQDDQAETVLLHLVRGAGPEGLRGMDYETRLGPGRSLIRPLLGTSRAEIEAYLAAEGQAFRVDPSNEKPIYLRNRVRLELLPLLEQGYNSKVKEALFKTAEIVRDDLLFLQGRARELYPQVVLEGPGEEVSLRIARLQQVPMALQRQLVRLALGRIRGDLRGIQFVHVEELLGLMETGQVGSGIHLPKGLRAYRTYDRLILRRAPEEEAEPVDFSVPLSVPGSTYVPEAGLTIEAAILPAEQIPESTLRQVGRWEAILDLDRLPSSLEVRSRRPGDRFSPLGLTGTKKVKDFFIDLKIPQGERDLVPLVASGDEIIWVVGWRVDDRFKVTQGTKRLLRLQASDDQGMEDA